MKSFQCLLSMRSDVHAKAVVILTLAEHMQKFCLAYAEYEIVPAYAQCA